MFEKPKESLIQIKKGIENKGKWNSIPWKEIEKFVHKLQLRIYIASKKQKVKEEKTLPITFNFCMDTVMIKKHKMIDERNSEALRSRMIGDYHVRF